MAIWCSVATVLNSSRQPQHMKSKTKEGLMKVQFLEMVVHIVRSTIENLTAFLRATYVIGDRIKISAFISKVM